MTFKAKKYILNSLGALFLASWLLFIYLYYFHFQSVAPIKPNPDTGQIYEVNNHGYYFYLTLRQKIFAFIPCITALFIFGLGAILEWRWKIYRQIYGQPRKPLP